MGKRSEGGNGGERTTSHRGHRQHRHHENDNDNADSIDRGNSSSNNNASRRRHEHRHHHRHHHHRSRRSSNDGGSDNDDGYKSRSNTKRESKREERETRSRHRRRRVERSRSVDKDNNNYESSDDELRRIGRGREVRRSRRREDVVEVSQLGRKRHRGGDRSDVEDSNCVEENSNDERSAFNYHRVGAGEASGRHQSTCYNTNCSSSTLVDWSSRRGRRQMPSLAYDVGQQKRFLGFMDRRDASGIHGGHAAAMTFEIGPDGLVQMPPPNTLVRQSRHHEGKRGGSGGDECNRDAPSTYQGRNPIKEPYGNASEKDNGACNDDNDSVASHESVYNDPATAHLGILPDILPPSNLYRVAVYGVDLSITAEHLSSMVTQLLGKAAAPYRVRRPAREMLLAAMAFNSTTAIAPEQDAPNSSVAKSVKENAPVLASSSNVLSDKQEGNNTVSVMHNSQMDGVLSEEATAGVLSSPRPPSGILTDTPVVRTSKEEKARESASGILDHRVHANEGEDVGEDEGVLPDVSSLPLPPQPAASAFYLPGLHDVSGPGGMVVLEFSTLEHASRTVQLLNGGYVNGRRIAASM